MNVAQNATDQNSPAAPCDGPWVEIDLDALSANYALFRESCPNTEVAAVVKCNGYGLGANAVAKALQDRHRCRSFFVVYAEEGAALRNALNNSGADIFCFAGPSEETLPLFETHRLTPVLNSAEQAARWSARHPNIPAALHVDTGMNRLGAPPGAIGDVAKIENLNISLVMSHLACASDPSHRMNDEQRGRFVEAAQKFPGARLSLSASAGALIGPDYAFDMIRPGIALYGGSPFDFEDLRITSVASLRTRIIQLRDLEAGEAVGYGAAFVASRRTRIATVALGYGDGYPRQLVPAGWAVINSEKTPIAGRVSMDTITLDVSDLKKPAKLHDIVEFFGNQLRLHEVAATAARSPYDLLTGLGGRVDRRYL